MRHLGCVFPGAGGRTGARLAFALAALLLLGAAGVRAANIEVQGVAASNAGKPPVIPKDLERFKAILKNFAYGTFSSAGGKTVSVAAGGKASVSLGSYGVDVGVRGTKGGKTKLEVAITDNGKPIADKPMLYEVSPGESVPIQVGPNSAPTIVIVTLRE